MALLATVVKGFLKRCAWLRSRWALLAISYTRGRAASSLHASQVQCPSLGVYTSKYDTFITNEMPTKALHSSPSGGFPI